MSQRERIVIHGLLVTLVLVSLPSLFGVTAGEAVAGARSWFEDLGPAESLTLVGEGDDASDIIVRNRDNRISWGDGPHAQTHSVAFVHIGKILGLLMDSEAFTEEREALREEQMEQEEDFRTRFQEFEANNANLTPEDPGAEAIFNQYRQMRMEFERWQGEQRARLGALASSHLERSYRDLVAAVEVVSARDKIDIVYRFIPTNLPFSGQTPDQSQMEISLRTVLKYPEGLDITAQVMDELSLEEG